MEEFYQLKESISENERICSFFTTPNENRNIDMHAHAFWELSYAYEGSGLVHYTAETAQNSVSDADKHNTRNCISTPMQEGCFLLASPYAFHTITSQTKENGSDLKLISCQFTEAYLNSILNQYNYIEGIENYTLSQLLLRKEPFVLFLSDDNAQNILHLMWLITHEYNHFTIGSELNIYNSLLSLLVCITRLREYQNGCFVPMVSEQFNVDMLLKYISLNYNSNLSLEMLAANMHLSREYLCRYFKKCTGKTLFDYIRSVRISHAKHLLRFSSHTIADIGSFCGYNSISSFQRAFRAEEGMSPSDFRTLYKALC